MGDNMFCIDFSDPDTRESFARGFFIFLGLNIFALGWCFRGHSKGGGGRSGGGVGWSGHMGGGGGDGDGGDCGGDGGGGD